MICIFTEKDSKEFQNYATKEADFAIYVDRSQGKAEILKSRQPVEEVMDSFVSSILSNNSYKESHSSSKETDYTGKIYKDQYGGLYEVLADRGEEVCLREKLVLCNKVMPPQNRVTDKNIFLNWISQPKITEVR